jgi:hypothetical protein
MRPALLVSCGVFAFSCLLACGGDSVDGSAAAADASTPDAIPEDASGTGDAVASDAGSSPDSSACPVPEGLPIDGGGGRAAGEVPLLHRASGSACPPQRAPSLPMPVCGTDGGPPCSPSDACASDSDCTAGPNGRCIGLEGNGDGPLTCTYDECFRDSDCDGGACACRPSASSAAANFCFTSGNCTIDSDCGPGGWCSPSLVGMGFCTCGSYALCPDAGPGSIGSCTESVDGGPPQPVPCICDPGDVCGAPAYFCHTPCDTCVNDDDCTGGGRCEYDRRKGIWDCFATPCTPSGAGF